MHKRMIITHTNQESVWEIDFSTIFTQYSLLSLYSVVHKNKNIL